MKFKEFIKPTIWKIIFTAFMVLIGAMLLGAALFGLGRTGTFWSQLLNILFGHFYYSARIFIACNMAIGQPCKGPTFDYLYSILILIVQIIFYYLIACLIGLLFKKKK
jgi:hypothetical protein